MSKNLQEQADRIFQISVGALIGKWAYSYTDSEGVNRQKYPFDSIGQALTSLIDLEDLSAQSNSSEDGDLGTIPIIFQDNVHISDDIINGYIAAFATLKGLIEVGDSRQSAFNELLISLGVKLAFDNELKYELVSQAYADKQAVEFADWATENLKRLLPLFSNYPNPDNKNLWRCVGLPPFDKEFYETEDLLPIFKKYRRPRNNLVGTQTT